MNAPPLRNWGRCPACGQHDLLPHTCEPTFEVWCPDSGGTEGHARTIYAMSPRGAAERWARWEDARGDYLIVAGNEARVLVRDRDQKLHAFEVRGETVPEYSADELDGEDREKLVKQGSQLDGKGAAR